MMYINVHTHHISENSGNILTIFNQYPWNFQHNQSYFSVGIHPIFIDQADLEDNLLYIEQLIPSENCLAIGEIGLDKLTHIPFDLQIKVFKAQLLLAEKYNLPVIIHSVRSYQEILQIRKELKINIPFIFHGFNKNQQLAQQIVQQNCLLSFGKNLLKNPNLQTIFANLSEEYLFLETDDSQISITEIYAKAGEIRNISVLEMKQIIQKNFDRIFKN